MPNDIRNQEDVEEEGANEGDPLNVHGQHNPVEESYRVVASDLKPFLRSKLDAYKILSVEGQLFLPPYD